MENEKSWRCVLLSEAQPQATSSAPDFLETISSLKGAIDERLSELTCAPDSSARRLRNSVRYSLLDGGKRLRPLATLLTAEALGCSRERALDVACAIEMVHCASLIIDDLPCMDDAAQRRGKATNHRVHGEDIAILGAITLISEAFGIISRAQAIDLESRTRLTAALADAIGFDGLCAGQERDLHDISEQSDPACLEELQRQKTGALFELCFEAGARLAGLGDAAVTPMRRFGHHAGLAFQILDDLLDTLGDANSTGKDHAQDNGKHTYAAIMSVDEAEARADAELTAALEALGPTGADPRLFSAYLDLVVQAYTQQISAKRSRVAAVEFHEHG